jgi:hypothetical protein
MADLFSILFTDDADTATSDDGWPLVFCKRVNNRAGNDKISGSGSNEQG